MTKMAKSTSTRRAASPPSPRKQLGRGILTRCALATAASSVLWLLAAGCSSQSPGCTEGSSSCTCSDGRVGTQACNAAGTFEACFCEAPVEVDGGTQADAGVDAGTPLWTQEAYLKASNAGPQAGFGFVALCADGTTMAVAAPFEGGGSSGINGNQGYGGWETGAVYVFRWVAGAWAQEAYIKSSNPDEHDMFGLGTLALSADGNTLAVGAAQEDSAATGVNGSQADNSAPDSGAVYVFQRTGSTWVQQAYLKASNPDSDDRFGDWLSISGDGDTLAIGSPHEANAGTDPSPMVDNWSPQSGAVYVFWRTGSTWTQQAFLKASTVELYDRFGSSVSLSTDGSTLAVGAPREGSNATGINGYQADNSAMRSGAAYVFRRSGSTWAQEAYVKAANPSVDDYFGHSVTLCADGTTLAVGAIGEDGAAPGQPNEAATDSGAVYLFRRSSGAWAQEAYLKASNAGALDAFGRAIGLSGSGDTLVIGASQESSSGDPGDDSFARAGAAYVFRREGALWAQESYLKASTTGADDLFGLTVAINAGGDAIAIGAPGEASKATGINGDQTDNSAQRSGAVFVLRRQ